MRYEYISIPTSLCLALIVPKVSKNVMATSDTPSRHCRDVTSETTPESFIELYKTLYLYQVEALWNDRTSAIR